MNEMFIDREEKKLVEDCLKGNSLAQQALFKKYYGVLLGVCLRYSNNRFEAKEILQEGFIKVFNSLPSFKFQGSLAGWIRRIMVNTAIDNYRKSSSEPITSDIPENVNCNDDVISALTHKDLLECVQLLPPGYKTVFNLFVIEGFNHKEIAEKLGIAEGTSKSQLAKAKEYLKYLISKRFEQ
jgi:RNA polymerase sigma-70 factor (ECF subfamily)